MQAFHGLNGLSLESDSDDEELGTSYSVDGSEFWEEEPLEISPGDEAAMAAFLNPAGIRQRTLADIILEKIKEKEQQVATEPG